MPVTCNAYDTLQKEYLWTWIAACVTVHTHFAVNNQWCCITAPLKSDPDAGIPLEMAAQYLYFVGKRAAISCFPCWWFIFNPFKLGKASGHPTKKILKTYFWGPKQSRAPQKVAPTCWHPATLRHYDLCNILNSSWCYNLLHCIGVVWQAGGFQHIIKCKLVTCGNWTQVTVLGQNRTDALTSLLWVVATVHLLMSQANFTGLTNSVKLVFRLGFTLQVYTAQMSCW